MREIPEQPVERSDEEWRAKLTPEQYAVCRCSATERAFTGKFWDHKAAARTHACLWRSAVPLGRQIRLRQWLAELHPAGETRAVTEHVDTAHGMRRSR